MSERADFRAVLRAELVEAAAHPLPRRPMARPQHRFILPLGAIAVAAAAAILAVVVLGRDHTPKPPPPAKHSTLPGRPLFGGSLERGVRYRSRVMRPAISFVAGGLAWTATQAADADYVELVSGPAGYQPKLDPPFYVLSFSRLAKVFDPASGATVPMPTDVAGLLRRNPDLRSGAPRQVTVAGRPATQLDFTVARRPAREDPVCRERFRIRCAALGPLWSVRAGAALRILLVRTGDRQPLLITVAATRANRFAHGVRGAQPVLDSLRIAR